MDMRDTIIRGGDSAIKVVGDSTIEYLFQDVVFEGGEGQFLNSIEVVFIEGQEYIVTIEGVDFVSTGKTVSMNGMNFVMVGNLSMFDGEDTGEPFAIASASGNGSVIMIPTARDMTTVTVSVCTGSYNGHLELNIGKFSLVLPSTYDPDEHLFGPYVVKRENGKLQGGGSRYLFEGVTLNNDWKTLLPIGASSPAAYSIDGSVFSDHVSIYRDVDGYYLYAPSGSGSALVCAFEEEHNYSFYMTGSCLSYADENWHDKFESDGFEFSIIIDKGSPVITPLDPKYIQLTSPNGTKYSLSVSDDGTLSAVPIE